MDGEDAPSATPLDPDWRADLIPPLSTRAELNEWEAANILTGSVSARRNRLVRKELLSSSALLQLHRLMFGKTWRWAGKIRQKDVVFGDQMGAPPLRITQACYNLCQEVQDAITYAHYPWIEIGARFHHRLVLIHLFPNGNGRHARLAADLLLEFNDQPLPLWGGSASLVEANTLRAEYMAALREADAGDYARLVRFVGSG